MPMKKTVDMMIKTKKRIHKFPSEKSFNILVYTFIPAGNMQESLEEQMQGAHKSLVEGCGDLQQQQECAVEDKMQKNGGTSLQRFLFWKRKLFTENSVWTESEAGRQKAMKRLFRFRRMKKETWKSYCVRTARAARSIWKKMKFAFHLKLSLKVCGEP